MNPKHSKKGWSPQCGLVEERSIASFAKKTFEDSCSGVGRRSSKSPKSPQVSSWKKVASGKHSYKKFTIFWGKSSH
jgi:hypothetical protein